MKLVPFSTAGVSNEIRRSRTADVLEGTLQLVGDSLTLDAAHSAAGWPVLP